MPCSKVSRPWRRSGATADVSAPKFRLASSLHPITRADRIFRYTAHDPQTGAEQTGQVTATDRESAWKQLRSHGLRPLRLEEEPSAIESLRTPTEVGAGFLDGTKDRLRAVLEQIRPPVNRTRLTLFTRQLATLVRAKLPLLRALQVVMRQENDARFRSILAQIAETIRSGGSLTDALAHHPRVFDRLYVGMIKAGELAGVLDLVLERLARFLEKAERIRGRVKAAMTYPVIILTVATAIVAALVIFVVPKFEGIFQSMLKGEPLPPLTALVLGASRFAQHHMLVCLAGAAFAGVMLVAAGRTRLGRAMLDRLSLRLPVLGPLTLRAGISRFSRTLDTLLAANVPILQALRITAETSGNGVLAAALENVHDRVRGGSAIAATLEVGGLFPPLVTSLVEVGEETGTLPEMLDRIADTYEEEVDRAATSLTSILEPLMIVVMAVVVGTIVIALFLPIIRIIQALG